MEDEEFYEDNPLMTVETAKKLVIRMMTKYNEGYIPFTWNGASFDWNLLAQYSGMVEECGRLCLNHVDGMFLVVAHKGFMLGLDKALVGANIQGKLHNVQLNDGTTLSNMDGSRAPELWQNKEFSAVKDYLRVDIQAPLKLAYHIENTKTIRWTSNSGKINKVFTDMLTVKEALKLPLPDTSWMQSVKPREDFYSWVPESVLKSEGVI
jgi:hypothetical protein